VDENLTLPRPGEQPQPRPEERPEEPDEQPDDQPADRLDTSAPEPRRGRIDTMEAGGLRVGRWIRVLAGVDEKLLDKVPQERARYTGLGGVVLGTATIAAFSMWFAISQLLGFSHPLIIFPVLIWFFFILNFDRWLVSSALGLGLAQARADAAHAGRDGVPLRSDHRRADRAAGLPDRDRAAHPRRARARREGAGQPAGETPLGRGKVGP